MTNHTRALLSSLSAFMLGCVGGFIVAVFGPLLFPASINGPSLGEDIAVFSMAAFFLVFGIGGFVICWRYTERFADKDQGSSRTFTK
jgi:hypothetical protein